MQLENCSESLAGLDEERVELIPLVSELSSPIKGP